MTVHEEWLTKIYALVERQEIDDAIDVLYSHVDEMLTRGEFAEVDTLCDTVDLGRLDTFLLVGVLSITFAAKEKLRARSALVGRVETRLRELAPERIAGLMEGLR